MTRLWLALVAVLLLAVPAQTQPEIYGNIDYPSTNITELKPEHFWLGGWAANGIKGGQQPYWIKVRLFDTTTHALYEIPVNRASPLFRPDVAAHLTNSGLGSSTHTGWQLVPVYPSALPRGEFLMVVEFSDGFAVTYRQRVIKIVDVYSTP